MFWAFYLFALTGCIYMLTLFLNCTSCASSMNIDNLLAPRRRDASEWCVITLPDHIAWKTNPDSVDARCWSRFSIRIPLTAMKAGITGSSNYSPVNCEPSEAKIPGACSAFVRNCTIHPQPRFLHSTLTCSVYWSAFGWNLSIGWVPYFPKMSLPPDRECELLNSMDMFPYGCYP